MIMFKIPAGEGSSISETLQPIINYSEELRLKAREYRKIFQPTYRNLDAFKTIENNLYMVEKLVYYFGNHWLTRKGEKILNQGDCEQINRLLRLMFVHCFSVIEYNSKELIKRTECEFFHDFKMVMIFGKNEKGKKAHVYLKGIMEKSKKFNIITTKEKHVWDVLREIRNAAVHNDAFFVGSDEVTYNLGNRNVTIKYGPMDYLRGDLNFPLILIESLMKLYHDWVVGFLKLG